MSLNNFEIIQYLGNQEESAIFKVKRKKDSLIYLLKNVKLNKKTKENVINEIKILSLLNHPNIIKLNEKFYDKSSNSLNLVFEFSNCILSNKINYIIKNKMRIDENIIWNILTQILIGLNYLHKKKIIHRNLKTQNIFLSKLRLIKITDFSLSVIQNNSMIQTSTNISFYTAPEIINKQQYNFKCDIWSVGCIIYEMINLSLPFTGENKEILLKNIMKGKFNPIPEFYSDNLKSIINDMLILDSSKRPSTDILLNYPNIKENIKKLNSIYIQYHRIMNLNSNKKVKILKNLKINNQNKNIINISHRKNKTSFNSRNPSKHNFLSNNNGNNKTSKKIKCFTYRTLKERILNNSNRYKSIPIPEKEINYYDSAKNMKLNSQNLKKNIYLNSNYNRNENNSLRNILYSSLSMVRTNAISLYTNQFTEKFNNFINEINSIENDEKEKNKEKIILKSKSKNLKETNNKKKSIGCIPINNKLLYIGNNYNDNIINNNHKMIKLERENIIIPNNNKKQLYQKNLIIYKKILHDNNKNIEKAKIINNTDIQNFTFSDRFTNYISNSNIVINKKLNNSNFENRNLKLIENNIIIINKERNLLNNSKINNIKIYNNYKNNIKIKLNENFIQRKNSNSGTISIFPKSLFKINK